MRPNGRDGGVDLREAILDLEARFPGKGIALMVFDFMSEGGVLTYISNAQREDMIRVLREHADRMEAGTDDTAGQA